MVTLFLIEDEALDRKRIMKSIQWNDLFIDFTGFAEDGDTAIRMIREHKPDIVLTDIRIPVKNGIQVANVVRSELPDTKIIFMSGYQDFDYVKAGIEYHVVDYILKPIDTAELSQLLAKTAQLCLAEKNEKYEKQVFQQRLEQSLPLLKESFYKEWIIGAYSDEAVLVNKLDFLGISLRADRLLVMVIHFDNMKDIEKSYDEYKKQLLFARALDSIENVIGNYTREINACCFASKPGEFIVCVSFLSDDDTYDHNIEMICDAIRRNIDANCSQTCTIGVSMTLSGLSVLPQLYKQALEAIQYRFYYGSNQTFLYNDVDAQGLSQFDKDSYMKDIIKAMKIGDCKNFLATMDDAYEMISRSNYFNVVYVKNLCIEIISATFNMIHESPNEMAKKSDDLPEIIGEFKNFVTIEGMWNWLKKFMLGICHGISLSVKNRNACIARDIKNMIDSRYASIVSVEEIAGEIGLSPSYASTVFKTETGDTIIHYLTFVRMENAAKLLKKSDLMVFEIAQSVGYNNATHFAFVFKNTMGVSPGEYRKSNADEWVE